MELIPISWLGCLQTASPFRFQPSFLPTFGASCCQPFRPGPCRLGPSPVGSCWKQCALNPSGSGSFSSHYQPKDNVNGKINRSYLFDVHILDLLLQQWGERRNFIHQHLIILIRLNLGRHNIHSDAHLQHLQGFLLFIRSQSQVKSCSLLITLFQHFLRLFHVFL